MTRSALPLIPLRQLRHRPAARPSDGRNYIQWRTGGGIPLLGGPSVPLYRQPIVPAVRPIVAVHKAR